MGRAFATKSPSAADVELFRQMLSTFRDGSGNERETDGTTRAGWRQIERCVAELLESRGGEDKAIFDVISLDTANPKLAYGFSVKSKQLSHTAFADLEKEGRVYMEIANSPAKFWAEIHAAHGYTEQHFKEQKNAQRMGETVLGAVEKWHREGKDTFDAANPGKQLVLEDSCYFCLSYSKEKSSDDRQFQVHIFPLEYPQGIIWKFKSALCLTGYDPAVPSVPLLDWYGLSGGQLKYYPQAKTARFKTIAFKLAKPSDGGSIRAKAEAMFKGT